MERTQMPDISAWTVKVVSFGFFVIFVMAARELLGEISPRITAAGVAVGVLDLVGRIQTVRDILPASIGDRLSMILVISLTVTIISALTWWRSWKRSPESTPTIETILQQAIASIAVGFFNETATT